MSDEKIDHAAEARRIAAMTVDKAALMEAQVHATLALVEQQRIANLIALAQFSHVAGDNENLRTTITASQKYYNQAIEGVGL